MSAAVRGDHDDIFDPDTALSREVDSGLNGEDHPFQEGRVAVG